MRLTLKQMREREVQIQKWIKEGLGVNDMALHLNIRPEAVRKFLKVREWETAGMKAWREKREAEGADSE